MNPQKCRLCGHEHWNSEPHVFGGKPAKQAVKPEKSALGRPESDSTVTGEAVVLVVHAPKVVHADGSSRHGKYADAEARKAYRREWMRKRRAA